MQPSETYLGDGLYVSVDGGVIQLRAPCEEGDHVVFLEAATLNNFLTWLRDLRQSALEQKSNATL